MASRFNWLARQAEKSEMVCRNIELDLVAENPSARLLDLGCGDGEFTLRVADKIGTNNICSIEVAEENIAKAREKGIEVYRGDLNQRLPFNDNSFDIVIASHVIEHLADTDIFLEEIRRILDTNGYLVIATPNLATWHNIAFLLFGKQPTIAEVSDKALVGTLSPRGNSVDRTGPAHRRIFTIGALKGLLEYYGFRIESSKGAGFFPFPNALGRIFSSIDKNHSTNMVIKARKV